MINNRKKGCFFGAIVGDALGMPYEFKEAKEIKFTGNMEAGGPFNLPKGCWTDDTSMTLCLLESLYEKNDFDAQNQLLKYLRWYEDGYMSPTKSCFDIGNQTERSLISFSRDFGKTKATHSDTSAGNGALMRINAIPLMYSKEADIIKYAKLSTITTHNNPECIEYSIKFALLLRDVFNGMFINPLIDKYPTPDVKDVNGYVVGSYALALDAFYNTRSFSDCMKYVINKGGDTDTNSCIAGMLAGAYYGYDKIPKEWVQDLVQLDKLENFYNLFSKKEL